LAEGGADTRGTITVRMFRAGSAAVLKVAGEINHRLTCTLKTFRELGGDFEGSVVRTGYTFTFSGISQMYSRPFPEGHTSEIDVLSCRDLETGEKQKFRVEYD
jgi:hypothetical protein